MRTYHMTQGSADWHTIRRGVPSSSQFHRIVQPGSGEPSTAQQGYVLDLIGEIVGDEEQSPTFFSEYGNIRPHTAPMQHGTNTEPEARRWYALETGSHVTQVGFVTTDNGWFGCSPDGLIPKSNAGLELKCPQEKAHLDYLKKGVLPTKYRCQVHGQLLICGFDYVDFVSYCWFHDPLIVRVFPDDFTDLLRDRLVDFLGLYWEGLDYLLGMDYSEAIAEARAGLVLEDGEILLDASARLA